MEEEHASGSGMEDFMFGGSGFSGIGGAFKLLSWLPFILSAVFTFVSVFLIQVLFYGLTQYNSPMTFGVFMLTIVISLAVAIVAGLLAKFKAERKMRPKRG